MKIKLIGAITASLFSFALLSVDAQVTHTLSIKSSGTGEVFNFIGVNLTNPVLASGVITGEAPNAITDAAANFTTALSGALNPFVKIISDTGGGAATLVGANTEVTGHSMTSLTTSDDLLGVSQPGDSYIVRDTMTIADIFGPNNEAGLEAVGDGGAADVIWVPNGAGGFDRIYFGKVNNPIFGLTPGWKKVGGGNTDHGNDPVYFTKGIFIERKAPPDSNIVIAGHVDTGPVVMPVIPGFNYLDRRDPIGPTLADSNLYGVDLNSDGDFSDPGESGPLPLGSLPPGGFIDPDGAGVPGADVVWMQKPDRSGWDQFYYNIFNNPIFGITTGWKKVGSGNANFGAEPLRDAFIIERVAAARAFNLTLKP